MQVKELIKLLESQDPEAEVLSAGPDAGGYEWKIGPMNATVVRGSRVLLMHSESPELTEWYLKQWH